MMNKRDEVEDWVYLMKNFELLVFRINLDPPCSTPGAAGQLTVVAVTGNANGVRRFAGRNQMDWEPMTQAVA